MMGNNWHGGLIQTTNFGLRGCETTGFPLRLNTEGGEFCFCMILRFLRDQKTRMESNDLVGVQKNIQCLYVVPVVLVRAVCSTAGYRC